MNPVATATVLLIGSNVFSVFVPFAVFNMHKPLKLDYVWAALCIVAAVYFVFRSPGSA
jgi:uncharacterized protein (DUF486 family)